jgi:hypothetical protein
MRWIYSFTIGAVLLANTAVAQALYTVSCGTEGGNVCTFSNPELLLNSNDGTLMPCDYGLQPQNGICVNANRRTLPDAYQTTEIGKAMHNQLYSVQADQPLNWITFFGTHNSFSSYREGVRPADVGITFSFLGSNIGFTSNFVADQTLSITDQLQDGARYIRLDPHFYDGELRLCHNSVGLDSTICGGTTYGRLFAYGVQEIAAWLRANPGEFVILRLNNSVSETDVLNAPIAQYLGDLVYQNYVIGNHGVVYPSWPSLRDMRASGKQILIMGLNESQWIWDWNYVVMNDGYSDAKGFSQCQNTDGNVVPNRPAYQFSYIGEDRSGSNALNAIEANADIFSSNSGGGSGLLDGGAVQRAMECAFGIVNIDFWDTGGDAYHGSILGSDFDFRTADDRKAGSLWTLAPSGSATGPITVNDTGPVTLNMYNANKPAWQREPATNRHPFLCAGPRSSTGTFPLRSSPGQFEDVVTASFDVWANGEQTCQREFGSAFHFWAPESAFEQAALLYISPGLINPLTYAQLPIWLNYQVAPVGTPDPVTLTPTEIGLKWHRGDPLPSMPGQSGPGGAVGTVKGGDGGHLIFSVIPDMGSAGLSPQFVNAFEGNGRSTIAASLIAATVQGLQPGTYLNQIGISDVNPAGGGGMLHLLPVTLSVTDDLNVSTTSLSLGNCGKPTGTIDITTGGPFTATPSANSPWITVTASAAQSPATLTVTIDTSKLLLGLNTGSILIHAPFATKPDLTIDVQFRLDPQMTISVAPATLVFVADGSTYHGSSAFCWAPGSVHSVGAAPVQPGSGGDNQFRFVGWSDGGAATHSVTMTTSSTSLSGKYIAQYLLTTQANNPAFGSIAVSPASTDGFYDTGTSVHATATATAGYTFTSFVIQPGNVVVTANPAAITMDTAHNVVGNFTKSASETITVTSVPAGLQVTVDGAAYTTPASFDWTAGTPHQVSAASQQSGPGALYQFLNWSDGGDAAHSITAPAAAATYTANYSTSWMLTVQASPSAGGTATGNGFHLAGTPVSVLATPNTGYQFSNFTGALTGTTNPQNITLSGPAAVTANFSAATMVVAAANSEVEDDGGGTGSGGVRNITIYLIDKGPGIATNAAITGITNITATGTGVVTVSPQTVFPVSEGTIQPNSRGSATVKLIWPSSVRHVTLTVNFTYNNGVTGSTPIALDLD